AQFDIGIVPGDGQAEAHEEVLVVDERIRLSVGRMPDRNAVRVRAFGGAARQARPCRRVGESGLDERDDGRACLEPAHEQREQESDERPYDPHGADPLNGIAAAEYTPNRVVARSVYYSRWLRLTPHGFAHCG